MEKNSLTINGKIVKLPMKLLQIDDVEESISNITEAIYQWGTVADLATRERKLALIEYKAWKAKLGKMLLEKNPKFPEWKLTQEIRTTDTYVKFKKAICDLEYNEDVMNKFFEALKSKLFVLQSLNKNR